MLMRGTTKRTRQQIQDELDRLKARVSVCGGAHAGDGVASRPRARTCRRCSGSSPRCCASRRSRPRSSSSSGRSSSPPSSSRRASRRRSRRSRSSATCSPYPKGDVRYVPTLDEERRRAQGGDARRGRRSSTRDFYGASNGELARRRRLRRGGDREARDRALRRLEEPAARSRACRRPTSDVAGGATSRSRRRTRPTPFFIAGHEPQAARRRPGLPGARARQLHARRRLPQLASGDAHPAEGGAQLRRGLAAAGELARSRTGGSPVYAIYAPQNVAKLESAFKEEIAQALEGRLHRRGARGGQVRLAAEPAGHPRAGRHARPHARERPLLDRTLAWDADLEEASRR